MTNALEGRPSAGNWSQDILNKHRKIVSWTPDCIVLLNGDTKIAGCNECKNKIDFQAFITSVSVNAGVGSGDLSSSIEMSIPAHYGDSIFKDGEFLFSTGVEVNVYYRGFFEIEGLAPEGDIFENPETSEKYDLSKLAMRPYYPVFHGVVTSVSFSFSGGFYSASLSCNGLLHFWANQKINTNAAYLAATPAESRGTMRLDGHVYTNMTPHQIIYDLFRDAGGSAGDAEWVFSSSSNQNNKTPDGKSLFSQTLHYWNTRFAQGLYSLRMYGASGTMFTSAQTAFLGDPQRGKRKGSDIKKIIKGQHNITYNGKITTGGQLGIAQALGVFESDDNANLLRPVDLLFAQELDDTGRGGLGLLATELKAFITDIGALGNVDLFSSQFDTKQSIADTVAEKVGYEFYQDVDGDLVFKPPFYNMDTSASRVYRIKREDILDISFSHEEPQSTYAICKGGMFRNMAGLGMEGTWGVKGTYVDYRLVAKYGWRPLEFDSTFFNTARSAFFAAVVELEKANTNVNGCSLSIPLRPELKPGYPVYVEHIDCYYYVTAVSHSFSFGGGCTTGLTLTARRKKFVPPGDPSVPGVRGVRLDDPAYPPKTLITMSEEGLHRPVGFPNVVMALDPEHLDPSMIAQGLDMLGGASASLGSSDRKAYRNMLIKYGYRLKVLTLAGRGDTSGDEPQADFFKGPWTLKLSDNTTKRLTLGTTTIPSKQKGGKSYSYQSITGEASLRTALREYSKERKDAAQLKKRGKKGANEAFKKVDDDYAQARANLRGENLLAKDSKYGGQATIIDLIEAIEHAVQQDPSYQKPGSAAARLSLLSNKKASFNPNQPGYYRYYSSSHPDPEHQGPRTFDTNEEGKMTLSDGARVDSTERNMVSDAHSPFAHSNEISFSEGDITRGLYTRTSYYQEATAVPTKDILFLSFQEHGIKTPYSRLVPQTTGAIKGDALHTAIKVQVTALLAKALKVNKTGKVVNGTIFKRKATHSPTFKTLSSAVKDESGTVLGDDEAITNESYAGILTNTIALIMSSLQSDWGEAGFGKAEAMDSNAVVKIVSDISARFGIATKIKGSLSWVTKSGFTYEDSWKSPIFPVSDENGYEVFGAYQYGRGLDIVPTNTFDTLLRADPSRLMTEDDLDVFLADLHSTAESNKIRGQERVGLYAKSSSQIVDRLVSYDAEHGTDKVADAYYRLSGERVPSQQNKADSLKTALANSLMTGKNDQVVGNVPVRISDIRPSTRGDASCDCRGDTTDIEIFLTDTGNFLSVAPSELDDSHIVQSFKEGIASKVPDWIDRQKRLMGDNDKLSDTIKSLNNK